MKAETYGTEGRITVLQKAGIFIANMQNVEAFPLLTQEQEKNLRHYFAEALRAHAAECYERAIRAQCPWCREGIPVERKGEKFIHRHGRFSRPGKGPQDDWIWCDAGAIWALAREE